MKIVGTSKDEYAAIVELWEASVRATHDFLTEEHIQFFKPLILNDYLDAVELRCAKDGTGRICGFVGVADGKIEMLFIHPSDRGRRLGKRLLNYAMNDLGAWKVDVNEQNAPARGFYEHMGFRVVGRSSLDGFGKPFPLLHMEYEPSPPRRKEPRHMLDTAAGIIAVLKKTAMPEKLAGMARVGINTERALGVSIPDLRKLAKRTVHSRELAEELWATEVHEARILAGMVCPVGDVDEALAERWVAEFDSWDICDQVMDLFAASDLGWQLAARWCDRPEEFVRRTGFGMFCWFAVHDKGAGNTKFVRTCFPRIRKYADDERNFVKKAVNWALRNIGKRNLVLNEKAIALAEKLSSSDNRTTRWIGKDALRELTSEKIQKRLRVTK